MSAVAFRPLLQVAAPGDPTADPTALWPAAYALSYERRASGD